MEAYIKYLGSIDDNYCRFARMIPKQEKRIDIEKFFNCSPEREKFIINKLKTDKRIKFSLIKPSGDTARKEVKEIEKPKRRRKK